MTLLILSSAFCVRILLLKIYDFFLLIFMYGIGFNIVFFFFSVPRNGSWPYINWFISLNSIILL